MAHQGSNTWLEIQDMKDRMDRLMDEVRERFDLHQKVNERSALWKPVTDVYETSKSIIIQMELPGLEKDHIRTEVKQGQLWVYGERRLVKEVSESTYHILERSYGPFARKFILPQNVREQEIEAAFQNGLLIIRIPKEKQAAKYKKIEVSQE